ncbi:MerR family transcriptional regulator [Streptomyces sp. NPDC007088]|uniref:MerR family transcriptional regulator n=1 Tax=Streptomyces sp. NPDC007088 TaxID=3364773 RepID=UPI0036C634B2
MTSERDTVTAGPALTVDELAARAGVTVRTLRFYGTRGLLPPPRIGPRRVGHYGQDHLARLALIEDLRGQGMTLAAIERYVERLPEGTTAQELAIHRAVVASWLPDGTSECSRAEAEEQVGRKLTGEDLRRLEAMGVLTPLPPDTTGPGAGVERYALDAGLLRLGARLLDLPLSLDAIRSARSLLLDHAARTAHELAALFKAEVSEAPAGAARSLSAHMQPIVLQALLTAFQRSLSAELRGALTKAGDDGERESGRHGTPR